MNEENKGKCLSIIMNTNNNIKYNLRKRKKRKHPSKWKMVVREREVIKVT